MRAVVGAVVGATGFTLYILGVVRLAGYMYHAYGRDAVEVMAVGFFAVAGAFVGVAIARVTRGRR